MGHTHLEQEVPTVTTLIEARPISICDDARLTDAQLEAIRPLDAYDLSPVRERLLISDANLVRSGSYAGLRQQVRNGRAGR